MAIAPISSIGHKGYTKNIQFEARKRENNGSNVVRNTAMAVPLTVLLAMSPLNPVDARISDRFEDNNPKIELFDFSEVESTPQVVKSMAFKTPAKTRNVMKFWELQLVDTDNNKNSFEAIMLSDKSASSQSSKFNTNFKLKLHQIHNYTIYSDDGTVGNKFKLDNYNFEDVKKQEYTFIESITNTEAKDFIDKALKSPANNSVTVEEYNAHPKLRFDVATETFVSPALNRAVVNKMKNAEPYDFSDTSFYKNIGSQEFQGDNGKYKFTYYAFMNSDKISAVSISKNGGPELYVSKNIIGQLQIKDQNGSKQKDVDYGCAIVVDGNKNKYAIVDLLLSRALVLIAQDSQTSPICYECVQQNKACEYLPKGKFTDLSNK